MTARTSGLIPPTTAFSYWSRLWDLITKPHSSYTGKEAFRARTLSAFTFFASITCTVSVFLPDGQMTHAQWLIITGIAVFVDCLYILSRTRYSNVTAYLLVIIGWLAIAPLAIFRPPDAHLFTVIIFLLEPLMIAAIFISIRAAVLVALVDLLYMLIVPYIGPRPSTDEISAALFFHLVVPLLLLAFARYNRAIEDFRRQQLAQTNDALADALVTAYDAQNAAEHALGKAHEANILKDQFLATISHELRTPLNAISGFSGMTLMGFFGQIPDNLQLHMERIHANAQRLLTLVNALLDATKIEAEAIRIVPQAINIQATAKNIWEQTSVIAHNKGIAFDYHVDPTIPILYTDPELLRAIVTNLLSNAIKFTEQGKVMLTISQQPQTKHWQIQVSDTGVGIARHAHNLVFDDYRQVNNANSKVQGSGLGLAIVKRYVKLLDGQIALTSEVGVGSTFTVILPLVTNQQPDHPQ